jgi:signal peptidase I
MDEQKKERQEKSLVLEVLQFLLIAAFIVLPVRLFIAQPFVVNGASMEPTFDTGQYLIVDQLSYRFESPKRGDVIVFKYPYDTSKYFIKRIIGLPGETVSITDGIVTIKNDANPQGFSPSEPYAEESHDNLDPVTLTDQQYFVMGDNRTGSFDSRSWGPLDKKYIDGRPFVRLFPLQTMSIFPGHVTAI